MVVAQSRDTGHIMATTGWLCKRSGAHACTQAEVSQEALPACPKHFSALMHCGSRPWTACGYSHACGVSGKPAGYATPALPHLDPALSTLQHLCPYHMLPSIQAAAPHRPTFSCGRSPQPCTLQAPRQQSGPIALSGPLHSCPLRTSQHCTALQSKAQRIASHRITSHRITFHCITCRLRLT